MRAHRDRRRKGLRCVKIELRETEVDVLIRRGLLRPDARNDLNAVVQALYDHLDVTLGASADPKNLAPGDVSGNIARI